MSEASHPRPAWLPPPDGSRDPRVDDPTNVRIVHLAARMLLPLALRLGISANAVSIAGFAVGTGAALAFLGWRDPGLATLGLLLCVGWLILDGLDGMVARATGTASALGRFLDGLCDHGVFLLLYLALGAAIDTPEAWLTGTLAGLVHGVQANFYESERLRYHRRLRGDPGDSPRPPSPHWIVRGYDRLAGALDRLAGRFDRALAAAPERRAFAEAYAEAAAPPLRLMNLLSANMRVLALYAACLAGDPMLWWWWELGPLTAVTLAGVVWLRRVERRMAGNS
ncbi:MAG TPA: CDP-alcohol phosphatidyltransferase family protein [Allosphingosinicella sp.]|nr:CDP-alcohol phosphatidyltransferase family protein [Allosphingosinicella sp.]